MLKTTEMFLDMLLNWVLEHADNDLQKYSALHIVASILNKQVDREPL